MSDAHISAAGRALRYGPQHDAQFLDALGSQKAEVMSRLFKGQVRKGWHVRAVRLVFGSSARVEFNLLFMRCPQPQEIIDAMKASAPIEDFTQPRWRVIFEAVRDNRVDFEEVTVTE